MRSKSLSKYCLAPLLSAFMLFAASPGQWSVAPVMWIALIPFIQICLSRNISITYAAKLGFTCGLLYNIALLYWIIIALGRYGGLPLPVSIIALLGLASYMALYFSGFAVVLSATRHILPATFSAPIIWVGFDQIKSWLFTGFPWLDLGYSQFESPLFIQIADITGHSGITFLIVMINALVASYLSKTKTLLPEKNHASFTRNLSATLAILLIVCTVIYSKNSINKIDQAIKKAPTISTAVIQGNIDQGEKWSVGGQEKTVQIYLEQTSQAIENKKIDLAIWPETALPFFPNESESLAIIQNFAALTSSPEILTGAPHFTKPTPETFNYFNSAFLLTGTNQKSLLRYDKQQLVPFGEYIPLQKILGILPIASTMGNFTAGQSSKPIQSKAAKLGVLICFESIFPSLARKRTDSGAEILVNLTNDAWYGFSSAPYQQMSMVVLRAVENRRSLARAANTGISSFVDPLGRIIKKTPIFERVFLVHDLPIVSTQSFFNRFGYLFQPTCLLLLSLIIFYGIVKNYRNIS